MRRWERLAVGPRRAHLCLPAWWRVLPDLERKHGEGGLTFNHRSDASRPRRLLSSGQSRLHRSWMLQHF